MKAIKTKANFEGIRSLDKAGILSARAKNSYIRTKQAAEETKQSNYSSPAEYAADSTSSTTQTVATQTASTITKLPRAVHENAARPSDSILNANANAQANVKVPQNRIKQKAALNTSEVSRKTAPSFAQTVTDTTAQGKELARSRFIEKRTAAMKRESYKVTKGFIQETKGVKAASKGQVKTATKSVKTAQQTIKTTKNAAMTAQKSAKAAAKSTRLAAQTAGITAKANLKAAIIAKKVTVAFVKAVIAAVKGLVTAVAAGGWVAVAVVLIICMIAILIGSVFGIFFSGETSPYTGQTINSVIAEINAEFTERIDNIINSNPHDALDMSGSRALWKHVLAAYTVRTVTDPDNPMEVATMNAEKAAILRSVFWDMNTISYVLDHYEVVHDDPSTGETYTETITVLRITISGKTADEISALYVFNAVQQEWLYELLKPEYHSLWNALLFGVYFIGDGTLVDIAISQIGNVGGETYWRWYGFGSRVAWCAIFVSWVADQAGYLDAGIIPRFASCAVGVQWFTSRGQWKERGYIPAPGDLIFFDWNGSGTADHVGIVERVEGGHVHTIEGNSSDSVRRRSYPLNSNRILGYGVLRS